MGFVASQSCFHEKDYLNHRYHVKRALYLVVLEKHLCQCSAIKAVDWGSFLEDARKPVLVLQPGMMLSVLHLPTFPPTGAQVQLHCSSKRGRHLNCEMWILSCCWESGIVCAASRSVVSFPALCVLIQLFCSAMIVAGPSERGATSKFVICIIPTISEEVFDTNKLVPLRNNVREVKSQGVLCVSLMFVVAFWS